MAGMTKTKAALFGMAALLISQAASAQSVVVRYVGATPAKFQVGSVVKPGAELAAGESLTLLTSQGTRELRGPQRIAAEPVASAKPSLLDGLDAMPRARTAAVRSGPDRPEPVASPTL